MNNELTNTLLRPIAVLTLYKQRGYSGTAYAEYSRVRFHDGRAIIDPAAPLSEDMLEDLAKTYIKENPTGIIHAPLIGENIISAISKPGNFRLIWWRPPGRYKLNFSKRLKIKAEEVHLPGLVFMLVNKTLSVYAITGRGRPGAKTKLFHAPFFNVYRTAAVCLGSAAIGKRGKTFEGEATRYETGFLKAEQNSQHGHYTTGEIVNIWAAAQKQFPEAKLKPAHKNISNLIQNLDENDEQDDDE